MVWILFPWTVVKPELGASFDDADAISSSVSSGFLHLVRTVSDTFRPQLTPGIKSCELWC